jgi:hypothetical protein
MQYRATQRTADRLLCPTAQRKECHARLTPHVEASRRSALLGSLLAPLVLASPSSASTDVGSYLPSAGVEDFVLFVPDKSKTPAIRAGTVDPQKPYRFALPPSWSERKVANIASGNYCQPRCAEPWTEVIFADDTEGKAQVHQSRDFSYTRLSSMILRVAQM